MNPHDISVDTDLNDGARLVYVSTAIYHVNGLKSLVELCCSFFLSLIFINDYQKSMLDESGEWQKYSIGNRESEFEQSLKKCRLSSPSGLISVKSSSNSNRQYGKQDSSINSYKRKRKHF